MDLTVTQITQSIEGETGNLSYLVTFSKVVDATPEIVTRTQITGQNQIALTWLQLFFKGDIVPYMVGSKWRLTVGNDGVVNLVKAQ